MFHLWSELQFEQRFVLVGGPLGSTALTLMSLEVVRQNPPEKRCLHLDCRETFSTQRLMPFHGSEVKFCVEVSQTRFPEEEATMKHLHWSMNPQTGLDRILWEYFWWWSKFVMKIIKNSDLSCKSKQILTRVRQIIEFLFSFQTFQSVIFGVSFDHFLLSKVPLSLRAPCL